MGGEGVIVDELTGLQTAIQEAIAEDWELVRGTAGQVNDPKGMFDLAYRFGWHAANKYHSGSDRIRELEAEVERMQKLIDVFLAARMLPAAVLTAIDEYEASQSK